MGCRRMTAGLQRLLQHCTDAVHIQGRNATIDESCMSKSTRALCGGTRKARATMQGFDIVILVGHIRLNQTNSMI